MRLFEGTPWDRPPRCDRCEQLIADCQCPPPPVEYPPPATQTARVGLEKRKKGKWVTTVRGLPPSDNDLPALVTQLKNRCGAGGTISDDILEIQGDHAQRVREILTEVGYRVR